MKVGAPIGWSEEVYRPREGNRRRVDRYESVSCPGCEARNTTLDATWPCCWQCLRMLSTDG